jgi:hypothetical protein
MNIPAEYQPLANSERHPRRGATSAGPADPGEQLTVSVVVRRRADAPPLLSHEHWVTTPPGRRTFLSRAEFADRFGADPADLDRVAAFGRAHGLTVVESSPDKRTVVLSGTVAQMSTAFAVELNSYTSPRETYRGFEGTVHLPADLAGAVEGVFGLDNRQMGRRASNGGPAGATPLTPPQVASLYGFPTTGAAHQTVGILELSGPTNNPNTPNCGFATSDVTSFLTSVHVTPSASRTITSVTIDPSPTSPGNSPFENASNFTVQQPSDPDIEVALDVEVVASVVPDADIVVYFTPATEQGWVDAINTIVADAPNNPSVLSISYGWPELEANQELDNPNPPGPFPWPFEWSQAAATTLSTAFQSAAMIGMTILVASGDSGTDGGEQDGHAHVSYPASDPWVTACGGTAITGTSPLKQVTWNDNNSSTNPDAGVTGGGISYLWTPPPPWQDSANLPPSKNAGQAPGRGLPDVAGNASSYSGYTLWLYGQSANNLIATDTGTPLGPVGGTSAVAPLYAALVAIINEALPESIGFLNPTLYAIGSTPGQDVFTDIADGATNAYYWVDGAGNTGGPSPGYTATQGWDACTGWGTLDGGALLGFLQSVFSRSLSLVTRKSTYGEDESKEHGGVFTEAVLVTVAGLKASEFPAGGITTLSPSAAQLAAWAPSIPSPGTTNIQFTPTALGSDDPSLGPEVQLFTFTYEVVFPDQSAFTAGGPYPETLVITASLPGVANPPATSSGEIELVTSADPCFANEANGGKWYLSEDLRVFYNQQGDTRFGVTLVGSSQADARAFIQAIVAKLNQPGNGGPAGTVTGSSDTFEHLPANEQTSALSLLGTATNPPHQPIYNFALARVRLTGVTEQAKKVRVFFRLWQAQSTEITYTTPQTPSPIPPGGFAAPPTGPFRQYSDGATDGVKVPLLGISADGKEYTTIPFFADERVPPSKSMTAQPEDSPANVQMMSPPTGGGTTYAYFGVWLDTNQTAASDRRFPAKPPSAPEDPDGGFSGSLVTIAQLIKGAHQCLVAEIVDDEAPIINGATPSDSDKIAQRNVAFTTVANPGVADSRLATHTFEIRPSPATLGPDGRPDELMIDWGQTPLGSVASIYLPAVAASDVLALAATMYTNHNLTATDAHTLQCPAGGITYIPIPADSGAGANFAGLFSVQLPPGIVKGQQFEIVVRQVTSVSAVVPQPPPPPPITQVAPATVDATVAAPAELTWRRVIGAFQITIPVSTKDEMLVPEERLLSVMRWIGETIPPDSRWYPVFLRYLGQLAGRVGGLGGHPDQVPPTGSGTWPGLWPVRHPGRHEPPGVLGHERLWFTGKIDAIVYDHFGDFEAFILQTCDGEQRRFDSHEPEVHNLVRRACAERTLTTVIAPHADPERPFEIILHSPRPPRP